MSSGDGSILEFWDRRAELGAIAGTNDFVLTSIEQGYLLDAVPAKSHVLDIGCGNGSSLMRLVESNGCTGVGFDFSEKMIEQARMSAQEKGVQECIELYQRAVPPVPNEWGLFQVAYSQRCLINLESTEAQKAAVLSVADTLMPGGFYVMIECFNEGSEETNLLRRRFGLDPMHAPWHNCFFNLHEVKSWSSEGFYVERVVHISSTYHFLSRAWFTPSLRRKLARITKYDSSINLLAARLPQEIGEFGPVKACIWRKAN